MSPKFTQFWEYFQQKNFEAAQTIFDTLETLEKQQLLEALFQKSEHQRTPNVISVLYRELHENKTFEDFHRAWFPGKQWCQPTEKAGQTFQQFFPAPTRVINAVNQKNPNEVISIGLTWVSSAEQGEKMWRFATANSEANQSRSDNISRVATKQSAKIYEPKSDDNLGVPF